MWIPEFCVVSVSMMFLCRLLVADPSAISDSQSKLGFWWALSPS